MATSTAREVTQSAGETSVVELFWAPGSSASLRLREFVAESGVPHELVNVAEEPTRMMELRSHGITAAAAVRVGDRYVGGSNLDKVAVLIGIAYERPTMLAPEALAQKYALITSSLRLSIAHLTPDLAATTSPDKTRTILGLAYHAASVMRMFLREYDPNSWDADDYHADMMASRGASDNVADKDVALQRLDDTVARFTTWWTERGRIDPLDRVATVYWGDHSLHEMLEREVWHTAQHTRQLSALLADAGIEPGPPLSDQDVEGLPLPKGLYA